MRREDLVAQGQQTRATIVRAAAIEFARQGYSGTSLSDIAAGFDKPKTALRYHFGSKAEIAAAVAEHQNQVWLAMVEAARANDERGLAGLLALLGTAIRDSEVEPYAAAVIQLRVRQTEGEVSLPPIPFSWFEVARSYVAYATGQAELPTASDPAVIARMLIDATFGVHQLNYRLPRRTDHDYDAMWTNLLDGLGATDPAAIVARTRSLMVSAAG